MRLIEVKEEAYYTIQELVDGFIVSRSSVYNMMQQGLRYTRFGGRRVIFGRDLINYLEENCVCDREISECPICCTGGTILYHCRQITT